MTRLGNVRDFELLKFLGKGTFGAVYQARRAEDKKIYAIKKVDTRRMSTKERTESVNEIRVLASISGPHVITFFEVSEADTSRRHAGGRTLSHWLTTTMHARTHARTPAIPATYAPLLLHPRPSSTPTSFTS